MQPAAPAPTGSRGFLRQLFARLARAVPVRTSKWCAPPKLALRIANRTPDTHVAQGQLGRPEPVARTLSVCSFGFFTADEARVLPLLARHFAVAVAAPRALRLAQATLPERFGCRAQAKLSAQRAARTVRMRCRLALCCAWRSCVRLHAPRDGAGAFLLCVLPEHNNTQAAHVLPTFAGPHVCKRVARSLACYSRGASRTAADLSRLHLIVPCSFVVQVLPLTCRETAWSPQTEHHEPANPAQSFRAVRALDAIPRCLCGLLLKPCCFQVPYSPRC